MPEPIVIESVSHWNATLRAAKEKNQPIFVDFFATWCGPCKTIAPIYEQLASQYPNAVFLKVDVDRHQAIAQKYQIRAMPTFYTIRESGPVDSLQGADPRGLAAMVAKHASAPTLPAEAEKAKSEGNAAFAKGDYHRAVEHYSRAIEVAPKSAVLYGNRALAYIKLIRSPDVPKEDRQKLRPKAIQDAHTATALDERWAKGWVRMGEAAILAGDEEGNESVAEHLRAEERKKALEGAEKAFENAVRFGEGKVKAEAQKMLDEVRAELRSL
ncbi:thioredoxin-domain-containing protein [Lentinus tigrinus ALCF2SS1-7]|uniref:Thioredoxin-domain-containing protein n=1 Tax=Lentinus tigrinus ALCF2SS1-6 TaxID=1328759 RepID=A0A5C2RLI9_9APHY|nr:thioredoxin-domain-containing protein [Lentinus tigrinus ALCF2SS1-6]RPD67922.1 thioredoxin-domain-containing protein [Lentinus tigrinus ALCF2SS1-7]